MDSQALNQYIDQLIQEKQFPDLTDEIREEIKKDLLNRLNDFINARLIAALSDEDVLIFENMLKEGSPEEEVQQFFQEKIPDLTGLLTQTLLEFKGVYLGTIPVPTTN
jgi:hypothetical protein